MTSIPHDIQTLFRMSPDSAGYLQTGEHILCSAGPSLTRPCGLPVFTYRHGWDPPF